MVFSSEDIAIIKHYCKDRVWNASQIWLRNPEKKWDKLIQKIMVWPEWAKNKNEIRKAMKQFVPHLRAVKTTIVFRSKPHSVKGLHKV